jgi:hypothetical protein
VAYFWSRQLAFLLLQLCSDFGFNAHSAEERMVEKDEEKKKDFHNSKKKTNQTVLQ